MKRLERLLAALTPQRWPVRWRLASVSAALTLIILVTFALVVGRLTSNRLQGDFNDELRNQAERLAVEGSSAVPDLRRMTLAGTAVIRVVYADGSVYRQTNGAPPLGPPREGTRDVGPLRVETVQIPNIGLRPLFLQYARDTSSLDATINRLWLFLGGGVLGGTLLAALAGIAIAGRAMRPVSSLTATAREIASTRDPSRRMPEPATDDEVAE